ncbi:MAG: hypothetical protein GY820_20660 [Gammaproteobacteria bacterium]|nr:hypothetical protein [Gammaproteobacteria bacterium]
MDVSPPDVSSPGCFVTWTSHHLEGVASGRIVDWVVCRSMLQHLNPFTPPDISSSRHFTTRHLTTRHFITQMFCQWTFHHPDVSPLDVSSSGRFATRRYVI